MNVENHLHKNLKDHKRIAINGGTFNPIHNGHLMVAQAALEQHGLDKVLWIPNGHPPHKPHTLDKEMRYNMVVAATAHNPDFIVSRIEIDREGPSYTHQTIALLREILGSAVELHLILGADNVQSLKDWEYRADILRECKLLVAARADNASATAPSNDELLASWRQSLPEAQIDRIDCPMHTISSTEVRKLVSDGRSIRYYVPCEVADIIRNYKLYQNPVVLQRG
jgi:nicotinate-nucleotide adenylyltransferase